MFVLDGDLAPRSGEVSLLPPLGTQEHVHTMCHQRAAKRLWLCTYNVRTFPTIP